MNRFEKPFIATINSVLPDKFKIITENLADDFLHDHMNARTSLDPLIADVLQGSLRLPIPEYVLSKKSPESEKKTAFERWGILKPSLNALASVFISDIWDSFATERANLLERDTTLMPHSLPELRELSDEIFRDSLQSWMIFQEQKSSDLLKEPTNVTLAYRQFKTIFRYGYLNGLIYPHDELQDFIGHGIVTAARTTWGVIDIVPRLATIQGLSMTKEQAIRTIQRAYGPVISLFSGLNKDLAVPILKKLAPENLFHFDPSFFYLRQDAMGYILKTQHRKLLSIRDEHGIPVFLTTLKEPTTWCPAKYTIPGRENVIRGFVQWNIALAARNFDGITRLPTELQ